MPRRFRPAVHGVMLRCSDHSKIFRIFSLHSGNESNSHPSCKKWIFAVGFLAASPARIAENINVRRPEVEALHDVATPGAHGLVMLGARFCADYDCHVVDQSGIESCGESNRFGEYGRSPGSGHSMESLIPPVIRGYLQPRYGARLVYKLRRFFLERHSRDKVIDAFTQRQRRIEVRWSAG